MNEEIEFADLFSFWMGFLLARGYTHEEAFIVALRMATRGDSNDKEL